MSSNEGSQLTFLLRNKEINILNRLSCRNFSCMGASLCSTAIFYEEQDLTSCLLPWNNVCNKMGLNL